MKTINLDRTAGELDRVVPETRDERVVLVRGGRPVAIVTAVDTLDQEDLSYIDSPDFWKMIAARRRETRVSLAQAKANLEARERSEPKKD